MAKNAGVTPTRFEVEQRYVGREGGRECFNTASWAGGTYAPHAVPLDLPVERPCVSAQDMLPRVAEKVPVAIAYGDPAEREQVVLVEAAAFVEEEQVHRSAL